MQIVNFAEYIIPLSAGRGFSPNGIALSRYAGVAFFLREDGLIATCAHIVDGLTADEILVGQDLISGARGKILNIRKHPTYDFAVGYFHEHKSFKVLPLREEATMLGLDVQAFGFTADGVAGDNLKIIPRLFKGSVVGHGQDPCTSGARSTVEISFPSHKGFSGAPLFAVDTEVRVAGMLFQTSNQRSSSTRIQSLLSQEKR